MDGIRVNGHAYLLPDPSGGTLLGYLRSELGLTGAKPGCGEGACGACTVLVDGEPVLACQYPLAAAAGRSVTTIEGLSSGAVLHPAQQALVDEQAAQCGYCIPGVALRLAALVGHDPDPDREHITSALDPSLCRCGSYPSILRAAHRAVALSDPRGQEQPREQGQELRAEPVPFRAGRPTVRRPWDLCAPGEREYLQVLGPGLVFVRPPAEVGPGIGPAGGGAWMHISRDGTVTAFSGKVNVGQGNTTALRMLVAEEADADLDRVRVVQGDTDLCPFDMGTFGSRSLPDSGEPLRRLAAGARHFLIERAAATWGAAATGLDTGPGVVIDPGANRTVTYGALASEGDRLVILDDELPLRPPPARRLVGGPGHGPARTDVVTGALRFGSDLRLPGMLHAAVLRPPAFGATLQSVDTQPAESLPGVAVVRRGDLIAALADSILTARQAVDAIRATWVRPKPSRLDIETYLRSHPVAGEGWERAFDETVGDVDSAFAASDTSLNATYTTAYLAHAPLETSCALAAWDDGRVTCTVGTQTPFRARSRVAEACDVQEADVRILVPPTGGAYGGKHGGDIAAEAAILARAAGRPVQVHWSRQEEFTAGYLRPMAVIDIRATLDHRHDIAAWEHQVVNAGPAALASPYRAAVHRLRSQPAASPVAEGSYRALGANANNFARESAVDELAFSIGSDPLEFRLRHLADDRLAEVLRRAAARFGWPARSETVGSRRSGFGLAVGLEKGGRVATCAEVTVDDHGHVRARRIVTAYECGTIVDPDTVKSQIEGGTVMALGGALTEAEAISGGRPAITRLADYPVPRLGDTPLIEVILVDRPDLPSAGAGETPMIAVAPAVANAVFNATGQRRRHLPLDPPVPVRTG